MERIIITEVDNTFNVEALSSYDVVYVPGFSNNHASPAFTDGATLFRTPTLVTSKYEFFKYFGNNGLNDYPRFETDQPYPMATLGSGTESGTNGFPSYAIPNYVPPVKPQVVAGIATIELEEDPGEGEAIIAALIDNSLYDRGFIASEEWVPIQDITYYQAVSNGTNLSWTIKAVPDNLQPGEVILLENARFFSEESLKRSKEEQSQSLMVKELSPLIDYFINDAFAAAHRGQVSLVGFTENTPSAAGRVMEFELKTIQNTLNNVVSPCVFALGGMKADDSIMVCENVCKNGTADYVLTSGLVANIFLSAAGYNIGKPNMDLIKSQGYLDQIEKCKGLLEKYPKQIIIPSDVALEIDGERVDVSVDNISDHPIFDIGKETSANYAKNLINAKTIFANGPAGVFEDPKFSIGTEDIINAIASSKAYSIIGGGHIGAATVSMGYEDKVDHVSSGGGACINLLAGKKLEAVEALIENKKKFHSN